MVTHRSDLVSKCQETEIPGLIHPKTSSWVCESDREDLREHRPENEKTLTLHLCFYRGCPRFKLSDGDRSHLRDPKEIG